MSRKFIFSMVGAAVLVALGVLLALQMRLGGGDADSNRGEGLVVQDDSSVPDSLGDRGSKSTGAKSIVVGGVARPQQDFPTGGATASSAPTRQAVADVSGDTAGDSEPPFDFPDYGESPAIAVNANVQVAAVAKAIQEKNRPELLSPAIAPRKFDPVAYAADPQSYLNSPEPGRVFAPAQPGPDVVEIRRDSGYYTSVLQGETVNLRVQAPAGSPVSFTSFDLGMFSNQLTTITVAADDSGVATAEFLAAPGTIAEVNVLAASPVTSGQVKFVVDIGLPLATGN